MIFILSYVLTTLVVLVIGYQLFFHAKNSRLYKEAAKLPGPPTWPFIGNAHYFIGSTQDILNEFMRQTDSYSSPYRLWLCGRLFYVIFDPENIKTILMSPKLLDKSDEYEFLRPWFGTGLFLAPAAKWKVRRKILQSTFNQRILNSFVEVFTAKSEILIKELEQEVNGNEFKIHNYVSLCLVDTITETTMGIPSNVQVQRDCCHPSSMMKEVFGIVVNRMFKFWLHPDIIFYNSKMGRKMNEYIRNLHELSNNIIRKKKQYLETNGTHESEKRCSALDMLIKLQYEKMEITDEEIREECDGIIAGGYESPSKTVSLILLMLASHLEVQDKVFEELYEIYGNEDPCILPVKHEDLNKMEYLERVIKETLRLFPPAGILMRKVSEDLELGNCKLIKGSSIILCAIKIHRSEKYWKDPLTFNPDRFLPEECAKRHPFTYLPFSAGPRNCIAMNYSMMSLKTVLAMILRTYVFKKDNIVPVKDIKIKLDLSLSLVDPITLRIEKRTPKMNASN